MIISIFKVQIENVCTEFLTEKLATEYCLANSIDVSLIEPVDKNVPDQGKILKDVSKRQLKQAMRVSGITTIMVVQIILAIEDELQKDLAMIAWDDSLSYTRDDLVVNSIGTAIGMTSEQIDNLWILAGTL